MDPEPLAKNLGHIHTSFLIVCARTLHTSRDINSEKNDIGAGPEHEAAPASSIAQRGTHPHNS